MQFYQFLSYDEIVRFLKSLLVFLVLFFIGAGAADAAIKVTTEPNPIYTNSKLIKFIFTSDNQDFNPSQEYIFNVGFKAQRDNSKFFKPQSESRFEIVIDNTGIRPGEFGYDLCVRTWWFGSCNNETRVNSGNFTVFKTDDPPAIALERYNFRAGSITPVYILNAKPDLEYRLWFDGEIKLLARKKFSSNEIVSSSYHPQTATLQINVGDASPRTKVLCMTYSPSFVSADTITLACDHRLNINVTNTNPADPGGFIKSNEPVAPSPVDPVIKDQKFAIPAPPCDLSAKTCPTAFGNISTDPAGFIKSVFTILLSLAGGVALLLIMFSGYRLMTSQGNPERVQAAREQLTSAVVGLLFIIFSVAILQIIGVDILKIPGFTR